MVVLDSDILIAALRNSHDAQNKILELGKNNKLRTTSINALELFEGARRSSKIEEKMRQVYGVLDNLEVLRLDVVAANAASEILTGLRKVGQLVDIFDILIAAIAIANQDSVATRNIGHFGKIPNLKVVAW